MNVIGVDPSSSVTGVAVAIDDELDSFDIFEAESKLSIERNMLAFSDFLNARRYELGRVDLVVIEKVSVQWNVNTIRKIAYFEAVALLAAADWKVRAIQVQATKARKRVFGAGSGGIDKERAYNRMTAMFPDRPWRQFKKGGGDETDASCLALAGPALLAEEG